VEALADGIGPDALILPQDKVVKYTNKIYPIPYENYPERTYKDTFVEGTEVFLGSQGVLGLPFILDPLVMYWNRDIFTNNQIAQAPTNWADFPILAEKISRSDKNSNILKSAVAFGEFRNVNNAKDIISALIIQAGSPITKYGSEKLVSALNNQNSTDSKITPAESAVRFYSDYSNPKKTVYSWNRALPMSKSYFLRGDLAVYFGFGSEFSDLKVKNPNLNFDIALFPQIVDTNLKSTFGKMQSFVILKSSKNIPSAYSVFSYLVGNEAMKLWLSLSGYAPTRRDIIAQGTSNAVGSILYNSALISKAWIDPDKDKTSLIFQNMIEDVTTGRLSVTESVGKASDEINNL
jgi:ABC-type glycerol-3-phosphate transport system substrate-binding protein